MGASADLHLIKTEHTMQHMAFCIIEAQLPGLLHAGSLAALMTGSNQIDLSLSGALKPIFPFAASCSYIFSDCILVLNCEFAPFADQPGQMQPGHHFSDDIDMQRGQGSSDAVAIDDTHVQLLQDLHEQQPPEFEEGQQAVESYFCLFADRLPDFALP